jgi:putative Mn2+ efflux pump MntP
MDFSWILLIGISLAVDCFAVSLAAGASAPTQRVNLALVLGTAFALFQAGMMVIGWLAGIALVEQISGIDHWLAFFILCSLVER